MKNIKKKMLERGYSPQEVNEAILELERGKVPYPMIIRLMKHPEIAWTIIDGSLHFMAKKNSLN